MKTTVEVPVVINGKQTTRFMILESDSEVTVHLPQANIGLAGAIRQCERNQMMIATWYGALLVILTVLFVGLLFATLDDQSHISALEKTVAELTQKK